ncbi:hypothetical protein RJT34_06693 [Clitoria ternatea]|uniref:Uncharacterized protein n=1 Tax=Clitoria ternatea TaxID=43366 RepID=A0AAN9K4E3_CLITE
MEKCREPLVSGAGKEEEWNGMREYFVECRKLWYLAGPAVFTSLCQYCLGVLTQIFCGHLSTINLAAVCLQNSVIAGFSLGIMLGNLVFYGPHPLRRIPQKSRSFRGCFVYLHEHIRDRGHGGLRIQRRCDPRAAKFSLVVAVITSSVVGLSQSLFLVIFRNQFPWLFSNSDEVNKLVVELTPMLALCIIINNVQPVLSGVAVGAGWQIAVAYVNIACYYILGVPLGLILGFKFHLGVKGIWSGMLFGTVVQTCVLFFMIYRTNWNEEASLAEDRIKKWGGNRDSDEVKEIN